MNQEIWPEYTPPELYKGFWYDVELDLAWGRRYMPQTSIRRLLEYLKEDEPSMEPAFVNQIRARLLGALLAGGGNAWFGLSPHRQRLLPEGNDDSWWVRFVEETGWCSCYACVEQLQEDIERGTVSPQLAAEIRTRWVADRLTKGEQT